MKHLYLIGGTMGVGKSATCNELKKQLPNCVFLDGDWCWDAHPFQVTDETKRMVMDNICHVLNNFLHCSAYEHILFCWVMHEQSIIDDILQRLDTADCRVHKISLICDPDTLCERLQMDIEKGIRCDGVIERSMQRLPMYDRLETEKIDTTRMSARGTADYIREHFASVEA